MKTFNSHISQTSLRNPLNVWTFLNVCTFNMFLSSPFSTIFAYLQTPAVQNALTLRLQGERRKPAMHSRQNLKWLPSKCACTKPRGHLILLHCIFILVYFTLVYLVYYLTGVWLDTAEKLDFGGTRAEKYLWLLNPTAMQYRHKSNKSLKKKKDR